MDKLDKAREDVDAITGLLVMSSDKLNDTFREAFKLLIEKINEEREQVKYKYEGKEYSSVEDCIKDNYNEMIEHSTLVGL